MKRRATLSGLLGLIAVVSFACSTRQSGANPDLAPDVLVFRNEKAVTQPFEVVSVIRVKNAGTDKFFTILTLNDAIPKLKEQARSVGANAIIIDESSAVKSGFLNRGISVTARAVLVKGTEQRK